MRARISTGSAWSPSDLAGMAQIGGQRVAFGPPAGGGGPVLESFSYLTPAIPDWADDPVNVGVRWQATQAGSWVGCVVWRAVTASPGGFTESVTGFNDDTAGQLTAVTPLPADGPRGAHVVQLFAEPVPVLAGVNYVASYATRQYGFTRPSDGWTVPMSTTRLITSTDFGEVARYAYGAPGNRPASPSPSFHFHVSPLVEFS